MKHLHLNRNSYRKPSGIVLRLQSTCYYVLPTYVQGSLLTRASWAVPKQMLVAKQQPKRCVQINIINLWVSLCTSCSSLSVYWLHRLISQNRFAGYDGEYSNICFLFSYFSFTSYNQHMYSANKLCGVQTVHQVSALTTQVNKKEKKKKINHT